MKLLLEGASVEDYILDNSLPPAHKTIKRLESIVQDIRNLAFRLHEKQERVAYSSFSGNFVPYSTHLQGVKEAVAYLYAQFSPSEIGVPREYCFGLALLHDAIEDKTITKEALRNILRSFFYDCHEDIANMFISDLEYLTKPDWKTFETEQEKTKRKNKEYSSQEIKILKKRRDEAYYKKMQSAPLRVKIVKFGDNTNNMATLDGKGDPVFSLKTAYNYRSSWYKMLRPQEIKMFEKKRILPIQGEERNMILGMVIKVREGGLLKNEEKAIFYGYYKKKWESLEDKGYRDCKQQYISPKELYARIFSTTSHKECLECIEKAFRFLIERYGDDIPFAIPQQAINAILRDETRIRLRSLNEKNIAMLLQSRSLEFWQEYYRAMLAVDIAEHAFSPNNQHVSSSFLLLEEWLKRRNITGEMFLELFQPKTFALFLREHITRTQNRKWKNIKKQFEKTKKR